LSKKFSFEPREGLPGRVWANRQYEWIPGFSEHPLTLRRQLGKEAGLKTAVGIPVVAGEEVPAVLAFFLRESRALDTHQLQVIRTAADQLGGQIRRKKIEEELRTNNALLQAIMDRSTKVIYVKDLQGRYITINREYEKRHHISRQAIQGKSDHDIFPKEQAEIFHANDQLVLQKGIAMEFEETAPHDDGLHYFISSKFPLFDSQGRPYAVCGISTDVTEQKRLADELRSTRDRLRQEVDRRTADLVETNEALLVARREQQRLIDAMAEERDFSESLLDTAQVVILLLDAQGQISYFNPYFEQLAGYSLEESKGKDWIATFVPSRDRERIRELFNSAINDFPVSGNTNSIVTKAGQEREIEWSAKTLKDNSGRTAGLLCSGIDITERRRAETRLRSFINNAGEAVISIDRSRRIVLFNPAAERIFGYSANEITGQKVNLLLPEPDASRHDEYIEHHERTGETRAIGKVRTVKAKRKSGELFPIEISVTKLGSESDVRYIAFVRDISEKVELQAQLVDSERMVAVGLTAAKIAHEIANPLNGLFLNAQLLEQRLARQTVAPDEKVTAVAASIRREISRLNRLLQDFRSLGRQEKYDFQPALLCDLIKEIVEDEKPQWEAGGIRYEQRLPADMPLQRVDRDRLKQALLNLVKNAVDAMPGGGLLSIGVSVGQGETAVEIGDTGDGISPGIDVFEPFVTTKSQGTGLGLMIARQIITAHGGSLTYTTRPGKGTTFRVNLPKR
jgi:PAS domain S-box-containing protein